jgi:hypothetical protein
VKDLPTAIRDRRSSIRNNSDRTAQRPSRWTASLMTLSVVPVRADLRGLSMAKRTAKKGSSTANQYGCPPTGYARAGPAPPTPVYGSPRQRTRTPSTRYSTRLGPRAHPGSAVLHRAGHGRRRPPGRPGRHHQDVLRELRAPDHWALDGQRQPDSRGSRQAGPADRRSVRHRPRRPSGTWAPSAQAADIPCTLRAKGSSSTASGCPSEFTRAPTNAYSPAGDRRRADPYAGGPRKLLVAVVRTAVGSRPPLWVE